MRICRLFPAALCALLLAAPLLPADAQPLAGPRLDRFSHTGRASSGRVPFNADPVATGLSTPVTFTFDPGGRIYYGEKDTGEIRILNPSAGTDRLFFHIPDVQSTSGTERGLLGLALHPDFPGMPFVYAYVTRTLPTGVRNQLVRLTASNGHGSNMRVLFQYSLTSHTNHNGGHIAFGPDGRLYAVVGENADPTNAQDTADPRGKVLRMTTAGTAAPGNPFGNRVWSYGLRNSFGFDFDPRTARLWETENGPECTDEINRIVRGGNFGWGPRESCSDPKPQGTNNSGPTPRFMPRTFYASTIAPTGLAFCKKCGLGSGTEGKFLFGDCNTGRIHRVALTTDRFNVASQTVVFDNASCVFSLETGPGGGIFFSDPGGIFELVRS
jgi:glucose/arabinose dehydrogenase